MNDSTRTTQVERLLQRLRNGDKSCRDELVVMAVERWNGLACRLVQSSGVGYFESSEDLTQELVKRLMNRLDQIADWPCTSAEYFFNMAAWHLRRQLLDMTKQLFGPNGYARKHIQQHNSSRTEPIKEHLGDSSNNPEKLAMWSEFHSGVDELPTELRQVVNFLFYCGMTQVEAAELLGIPVSTVKSRWKSARAKLINPFN